MHLTVKHCHASRHILYEDLQQFFPGLESGRLFFQSVVGLHERLLSHLALRCIDVDSEHSDGLAILVSENLPPTSDPTNASIRPDDPPFSARGHPRLERIFYQFSNHFTIIWMHE